MLYAQIKDQKIINIIILNDEELLDQFSEGFDFCLRIDELETIPQIDWNYEDEVFSPPSIPELTNEEQLDLRITWGNNIIKQFRVYTLGISDEEGLQMLGNLMDVKMSLELGMLSAGAYLLSIKPEDPVLDAPYDDGQTVRERFLNMILSEGPTP